MVITLIRRSEGPVQSTHIEADGLRAVFAVDMSDAERPAVAVTVWLYGQHHPVVAQVLYPGRERHGDCGTQT